jgi:DegV family protein with EDD domain
MAVKIVTDSTSDITSDLAQKLGVTVVPLTVSFGHESFLDRVDISTDDFYRRLARESIFPTTTQPSPGAFAEVYEKLAGEADGILVITISSKLSGTYQSAINARQIVDDKCRIEVIDSASVAMGLGLIVIAAAEAANRGAGLDEVMAEAKSAVSRSHMVIYFETLQYLAKGGRIGKAKGLLGAMLSIKQILTVKDGEMAPLTQRRSKPAGMEYIHSFAAKFSKIDKLALEYCTTPEDIDKLAEILDPVFPKEKIYRSTVSPVLGAYAGPGALAVSILEAGD